MKNTESKDFRKLHTKRLRKLERGRVKGLNPVTYYRMYKAGKKDGRKGIPKEYDNGVWTSAFIENQKNAFEEFCGRVWGRLQLEDEKSYVRISNLINEINYELKHLEDLRARLSDKEAAFIGMQGTRKTGEENLTEMQVIKRRKKEHEKDIAPVRNAIQASEKLIADKYEEFSGLLNRTDENINTVHMICSRAGSSILQRIDVYWGAALKMHPAKMQMPSVPEISLQMSTEQTYMDYHEALFSKAKELMLVLSGNKEVIAQ